MPLPPARRPQGINVSQAQRQIDWKEVARASRFEFAYIRSSEGISGRDRYYQRNYNRARDAGLRVGAFHRGYMTGASGRDQKRDALKEARKFIDVTGKARPNDMVPMLGVEPPFGGLRANQILRWIDIWMTKVRRALRVRPGIYVNGAIWFNCCLNSKRFARDGHRLWISTRDLPKPNVPAGDWAKKGWTVWQRAIGDVQGINEPVNKNVVSSRTLKPVLVRNNRR